MLDVDCFTDRPPKYLVQNFDADPCQDVSVIRLYGINEKGNSITVNVYNFSPYFYI